MPSEFLPNVPYKCEVIVTNVSPMSQSNFNVFMQIPAGSMPMKRTKAIESRLLSLSSYSTKKLHFEFYFPTIGAYGHFPSNVSVEGQVAARSEDNILVVVKQRTLAKDAADLNFDDLVQVGDHKDILDYLRTNNLHREEKGFNFSKILWLMKDVDFWTKAIEILRAKHVY